LYIVGISIFKACKHVRAISSKSKRVRQKRLKKGRFT